MNEKTCPDRNKTKHASTICIKLIQSANMPEIIIIRTHADGVSLPHAFYRYSFSVHPCLCFIHSSVSIIHSSIHMYYTTIHPQQFSLIKTDPARFTCSSISSNSSIYYPSNHLCQSYPFVFFSCQPIFIHSSTFIIPISLAILFIFTIRLSIHIYYSSIH